MKPVKEMTSEELFDLFEEYLEVREELVKRGRLQIQMGNNWFNASSLKINEFRLKPKKKVVKTITRYVNVYANESETFLTSELAVMCVDPECIAIAVPLTGTYETEEES
jgi:nitrate reductase beta subunit